MRSLVPRGRIENTEIGVAMKELFDLCDERGLDFLDAQRLAERIAAGDLMMVESTQLVTRHLLFREAVKNAKAARDQAVERAVARVKAARPDLWGRNGRRTDIGDTRVCRHCEVDKPIDDFARTNGRVDGSWNRAWVCRSCWKIRYPKKRAS